MGFLLAQFVLFGLGNLGLKLNVVLLLILVLVRSRELDQLHEQGVALHRLVSVATFQDLLVVLLERVNGVGGTTASVDRVKVLI